MAVKKTDPVYDVVIIGSGAAGGMAAWNLTRQGVNVLMLDAAVNVLTAPNTGHMSNRGRSPAGWTAANTNRRFTWTRKSSRTSRLRPNRLS